MSDVSPWPAGTLLSISCVDQAWARSNSQTLLLIGGTARFRAVLEAPSKTAACFPWAPPVATESGVASAVGAIDVHAG
ncbi:hypothetical protein [Streptomyces sp. NPDC042319]|uniref:hypothetical protein n=1 Tax=Streptomyces sp. NPDC042319 TaxID=3154332 RepID=UPI0033DCF2EF